MEDELNPMTRNLVVEHHIYDHQVSHITIIPKMMHADVKNSMWLFVLLDTSS